MLLEIKNLVKRYGDFLAVDNVNLSIEEGEILGLLGPNGAGKTTIIDCIIGLNKIDSGSIRIFGMDFLKNEMAIKKSIGIVTQTISVYDDLNVYDNVMYFGGMYGLRGKKLKEYAREALNFVGIWDNARKFPKQLSGGMLRRLNIACGIVHKPKLIIMDEPTAGIDPKSRSNLLESIKELNKNGATIIYTSHYMEEIERICSSIAIINEGRIIAKGDKEELKSLAAKEEKIKIKPSALNYTIVDEIKKIYGVKECSINADYIDIVSDKNSKNIAKIIDMIVGSGLEVLDVIIDRPSIETVFLALTGRNLDN
ncbi:MULTISPECIES: ABC transporter ATP-binding protein [Clostridium]|uniref:ABC-type multidrug transport system, ATP-ase component n=1 Tax=Clostridium acetobutylicum (strain ATCC 824 / DSM 792 / JCM 1419 / IAM 19013 / LMG 5710 / NBRC 13948 / NRRL B-527 / VKM B-1787 / 2291 / W) TaxID=272562 RepID=Q97MG2_CLOAB|nr:MULTISPECIES: ABC transporter ATP-binding protein [Clostridium]AAK78217.1 ABC-type multidrug transport system, ATP-ase component [Clostridium acetobutylicum ATCC 824]ADZ19283.1 ABC-type multidrug transport system, ATP-ase component [Clostridium acetobutylicum EA 2018]AEI31129.1 ABC-type multidrug transport system, ATP-ase component [Clostridium acetobutylicum DSM 1731]AWV82025.1 ABC transporter ATP-binding protein [Clostridium acetobutylicum]MBC2396071.1 ABC transporter ATP-binding protein 